MPLWAVLQSGVFEVSTVTPMSTGVSRFLYPLGRHGRYLCIQWDVTDCMSTGQLMTSVDTMSCLCVHWDATDGFTGTSRTVSVSTATLLRVACMLHDRFKLCRSSFASVCSISLVYFTNDSCTSVLDWFLSTGHFICVTNSVRLHIVIGFRADIPGPL